jgi:hypothetical protein
MSRPIWAIAPLLMLAGCGSEAPAPVAEEKAAPAAFPAGEWEITTLTESLKSADKSVPATIYKEGATVVAKVCAAPGPKPDPALFIEKGDSCTTTAAYAKDGRISISYNCTRPGRGLLTPTLDGKYDADTFEVAVSTGSYFKGDGDYVMTQNIKGGRLGDCAPAAKPAG